jgi:Glycosyl transferase family 2/GAF domain
MQPKRPFVSVVIPTLNESSNLPLVLPFLPMSWIDEVIVVDGRSTDNTVDTARRFLPSIRVVLETRHGKGAAMQAGFAAAHGDIIVTMDADGSNDPREIPRMVQALLEGADFVKGSRFAHGGGTTDMPRYRKLGNWALGSIANLLFNGMYTDLCYGYHAFWRHALPIINSINASGFEIDTAIYVRALRHRLRVTETPSFEGYRFFGIGKLQTIPDGWRVLATIFHEWWLSRSDSRNNLYLGFRGQQPINAILPSGRARQADMANAMESIYTLTHEIAAETDPQERLVRMLRHILVVIGAKSGSVLLVDEAGRVTRGVVAYAGEFHVPTEREVSDLFQAGLAGWVVEHRQAALVPSTLDDPRWLQRPWERPNNLSRSAVSVPLSLFERPIGVITLVTEAGGQFTQNDLALLSTIAVGLSLSAAGFILPPSVPIEPLSATSKCTESEPAEFAGARPVISSATPHRLS